MLLCTTAFAPLNAAAITPPPGFWCAYVVHQAPLEHAAAQMCSGDKRGAVRTMGTLLPSVSDPGNEHYYDVASSYFFALLATGQDARARDLLTAMERRGGTGAWTPSAPDRAFLSKKYADSYAAFVSQDGDYPRNPDAKAAHVLDPHYPAALARLRAGDVPGAIAEQVKAPDDGSLYTLMFGDLYAQAGNWNLAYQKWLDASRETPPDMVFAAGGIGFAPDQWNTAALEFIYYFRAHAPDRTT